MDVIPEDRQAGKLKSWKTGEEIKVHLRNKHY